MLLGDFHIHTTWSDGRHSLAVLRKGTGLGLTRLAVPAPAFGPAYKPESCLFLPEPTRA